MTADVQAMGNMTGSMASSMQGGTTYNGNTVVSQVYDGSNVLQWTKTTTYNGNTIQEVYS